MYLKRRTNFLSNHGTHDKQKWKVLEKKIIEHSSGGSVWNLKNEKLWKLSN